MHFLRGRALLFTMRDQENVDVLAAAQTALLDYCERGANLADARLQFMDLIPGDRSDIDAFEEAARFYSALVSESRNYLSGLRPSILDHWPAWEYHQAFSYRGLEFWTDRWTSAGGRLFEGRMIALKDDPVWLRLSQIGLPHPPFEFGYSGMRLRSVDR